MAMGPAPVLLRPPDRGRAVAQHGPTLPRRCPEPTPAEAAERTSRGLRVAALVEQTVERRTGARDVGAEGACRADLLGERRAHEVVGRQGGEVARPLHPGEPVEKRLPALRPAGGALAGVEGRVDV